MAAQVPVRSTQSFVYTLTETWRRPSLTALEVAWRWLIGIPALWLAVTQVRGVLLAATDGTLNPARIGLDQNFLNDPVGSLSADPLGAAAKISGAFGYLAPGLLHIGRWLVPLLVVGWVIVSSLGRTLVLRRADPSFRPRPFTLMALQMMRVVTLAIVFWLWFLALGASTRVAIHGPTSRGEEPNLVLFCAMVIVASLGLFTAWGFVSWRFSVAPLLAMADNFGVAASLRAAGQLGTLKTKLVEINLVLAVVKIALIVLAMVFSATPLPFESVTTPGFLATWWEAVAVVYVLWSDFFHVTRLIGYLNLWRAHQAAK